MSQAYLDVMTGGYAQHNHVKDAMEFFIGNAPRRCAAKKYYLFEHVAGKLGQRNSCNRRGFGVGKGGP